MKNRIIAILLATAMVFGVVGCGDAKKSDNKEESTKTETVDSGEEKEDSSDESEDEGSEGTENSDFNYDDEHVKSIQSFLEKQKYYGYSGQISENDKVMISAEEYYDFKNHIVEDISDYSGYRDALHDEGYTDDDIGTTQVRFHSFIDCVNKLYVEIDKDGGWNLNESSQSNVDYETGANYSNAWELWVSTMISSNLYFKNGTWSEDGNTVSYAEDFEEDSSKETITMTFERQKDKSLKPVDFTSSVTTTTTSEGYDVDEDGNVSDETTTKTTAVKNKTYMVYDYEDHKLKVPKYTVVEDESAVDEDDLTGDTDDGAEDDTETVLPDATSDETSDSSDN